MGLFYLKKNNFGEEDGETAQFTDFYACTTPAEGSDLALLKAKETESIKEMEDKVNKGHKEQE